MQVDQRIYYLEMTDPAELRPARAAAELEVRQAEIPCPELNRFFYSAVGRDWFWIDRLPWTCQQWTEYATRPEFETWLAYLSGTPAGYFELDGPAGGDIELASLGLLPQFVGRGLGGPLLTIALRRAWHKGARRVWLHTCTHDHPHALPNYLARGLRPFREEVVRKEVPDGKAPAACGAKHHSARRGEVYGAATSRTRGPKSGSAQG